MSNFFCKFWGYSNTSSLAFPQSLVCLTDWQITRVLIITNLYNPRTPFPTKPNGYVLVACVMILQFVRCLYRRYVARHRIGLCNVCQKLSIENPVQILPTESRWNYWRRTSCREQCRESRSSRRGHGRGRRLRTAPGSSEAACHSNSATFTTGSKASYIFV